MVRRMLGWPWAVRSREEALQERHGIGTETTRQRVGSQGMPHAPSGAASWAMRHPAQDGHKPRRVHLKGSRSSW